jgi:hypothetical protein
VVQFYNAGQEQDVKRRRRQAKLMLEAGKPQQTQMMGNVAIPQSPLEQLARGLSTGIGAYNDARADTDETDIAQRRADLIKMAGGNLGKGDFAGASEMLMQDPALAAQGIGLAGKQADIDLRKQTMEMQRQQMAENASYRNAMLGLSQQRVNQGAQNPGGATGYLIQQYMDATGKSFPEALYAVQTGMRQGMSLGPDGMVAPIPGVPDAKGDLAAAVAGGKIEGTATGNAKASEGDATAAVQYNNSLIDQMIGSRDGKAPEHPGLSGAVGPLSSKLPTVSDDVAGFENLLTQVQGTAFLDSIQSMKGLGALSNAEGEAATRAATRMKAATSEDDFRSAAIEYRTQMNKGLTRLKQKAQGNFSSTGAAPSGGGATFLGFE